MLLLVALWSSSAVAQTRPNPAPTEKAPSELERARQLFEDGVISAARNDWETAGARFRDALSIKETPGIRFHLARCEEQRGALLAARRELKRARELLAGGASAADVERLLPETLRRVEAKLARLTFRVAPVARRLRLTVDGKHGAARAEAGHYWLEPGQYRIRATARDHEPLDESITLAAGEERQIALEFAPRGPSREPHGAPSSGTPHREDAMRTILLLGEASIAIAAAGTGLGFWLAGAGAERRIRQADARVAQAAGADAARTACSGTSELASCAELERAAKQQHHAERASRAAFLAAGVAAVGFGLTWWFTKPKAPQPYRVEFQASPRGEGLRLTWSGAL
jgi:hypothetical protein